ncbi:glycosyltransferase [Acidovorax sp. D2M1]|uniref:Glycosyltransferase n=1 Tax=Acidovorax benzenivorans TaxID=2987520 RepID=A0ABT5RWW4_9BURK|nr:glycosyltransferase [Acidovorax benzenivorans]MDD2177681.1 glycosyltransferase [Acidovorax benzenivorans]
MRILFIHQNFPGQFKYLAPALAARGHEVVALGINQPSGDTLGVKVVLHRPQFTPVVASSDPDTTALYELHKKMERGISVARALQALQRSGFTPDLVYAHSGWGEAFYIKDVFPETKLLVYAEYFYQANGGDSHFDPEFSRSTEGDQRRLHTKNLHLMHALTHADCGLSPTLFQRDRHPQALREHIEVIHDGIDTERFAPAAQAFISLRNAGIRLTAQDEIVTFAVRELEPYRGYHIFMRALPELLAQRPKAHVIIVGGSGASYGAAAPAGTTWRKVFHDEVANRIDHRRVHFVGKLPHATLTQLMQVSTVHAYLTYPFVLSWSLMEAMSVGCLIVASDTAPVQEHIRHGENGLLVDFFDPQALANTIAQAIEQREELRRLRSAARSHVVANLDLQRTCLPAQINLLSRLLSAPL